MPLWLAFLALAFVVGSIPFGVLIGKARGVDIRAEGSGNPGATNVGRLLGFRYFLLCFLLDMGKGLAPTLGYALAAGLLDNTTDQNDAWRWVGVMAAAVLGHMFSPFLGFKGGKGVATGLGALLGVFPELTVGAGVAFVAWGAVFALSRMVSLASILAALALPAGVAIGIEVLGRSWGASLPFLIVASGLALLVIVRHHGNIRRLLAGTEHRFTRAPAAEGGDPTPDA